MDFMSVATHEMHDLCREAGETVQVCGRDGDYMLVLAMADGPSHFQVASRVGTRVPLNWTASGRLLAGQSIAMVPSSGGGYGDPTKRDRDLVRKDLREERISAEAAKTIYGLSDS